jgi:hypothetical protein
MFVELSHIEPYLFLKYVRSVDQYNIERCMYYIHKCLYHHACLCRVSESFVIFSGVDPGWRTCKGQVSVTKSK